MEILYKSTRGDSTPVTASMAILKGLSEDGGLFVPTQIPALDIDYAKLAKMSYQEVAYVVMSKFLTDFSEEELKTCIARAYDSKFDTEKIAPVKEVNGIYYLELFHGATIAFKDMALSILPHLMTTAAKKNQVKNEISIKGLTINKDNHKVTVYGEEIKLTPIEFDILYLLASNPGRVFSTDEIFEKVWNEKVYEANNTVMVHIRRLRGKMKEDTRQNKIITTVWGVGYKIEK